MSISYQSYILTSRGSSRLLLLSPGDQSSRGGAPSGKNNAIISGAGPSKSSFIHSVPQFSFVLGFFSFSSLLCLSSDGLVWMSSHKFYNSRRCSSPGYQGGRHYRDGEGGNAILRSKDQAFAWCILGTFMT